MNSPSRTVAPPDRALSIAMLGAGAGGMYCGSCLRDNTLAATLMRLGQRVTLIPLYTPIRTDERPASIARIFYGGVNVYLQSASRLFRTTPRILDRIWDQRWLLKIAGRFGAQTPPSKLGSLTCSIVRGLDGPTGKEIDRLIDFLRREVRPDVVTLPNAMFIGFAEPIRRELGAAVVCELTGEDIFLEALTDPWRDRVREEIRGRARFVSRFVATSHYYAGVMADYLGIARAQIGVVYPGLSAEFLTGTAERGSADRGGRTLGYLARICPEKGLNRLFDGFVELRRSSAGRKARLHYAGYLGAAHRRFHDQLRRKISAAELSGAVHFAGELDLRSKHEFLREIDVFSVPAAWPEAKGIYLLEAWAHGIPVVQPASGSFPELIDATGGGVLVPPDDPKALAAALARLLDDPAEQARLGDRARRAVFEHFTDEHMAHGMLEVFRSALAPAELHLAASGASIHRAFL